MKLYPKSLGFLPPKLFGKIREGLLLRLSFQKHECANKHHVAASIHNLAVRQKIGKAYSGRKGLPSGSSSCIKICPALCLALNAGLRDAEIRNFQLGNIHLDEQYLVAGKSTSLWTFAYARRPTADLAPSRVTDKDDIFGFGDKPQLRTPANLFAADARLAGEGKCFRRTPQVPN